MKSFIWNTFTKKIAVKASLKDIYNAWTKPEDIETWFLSKTNYFDENNTALNRNLNCQKNHTYQWSWFLYDIVENGRITEANGKDFLQFTFAGECLVDIRLSEQKDHVVVELTQKNIPEDDQSKRSIRLGCDSGWSFFLVNLKSVYEGGLDLRCKDIDFKGLNN
jgi:uncharacterized protein YndB with AHSA1/START domain